MEKDNKLTYDDAIRRAETIIAQLEQSDAISMEEYKSKAQEVTALLNYCRSLIAEMNEHMAV